MAWRRRRFRQVGLANTMKNFGLAFLKALDGLFIDRLERNEEIAAPFFNEPEFQRVVGETLREQVYEQIHARYAPKSVAA